MIEANTVGHLKVGHHSVPSCYLSNPCVSNVWIYKWGVLVNWVGIIQLNCLLCLHSHFFYLSHFFLSLSLCVSKYHSTGTKLHSCSGRHLHPIAIWLLSVEMHSVAKCFGINANTAPRGITIFAGLIECDVLEYLWSKTMLSCSRLHAKKTQREAVFSVLQDSWLTFWLIERLVRS